MAETGMWCQTTHGVATYEYPPDDCPEPLPWTGLACFTESNAEEVASIEASTVAPPAPIDRLEIERELQRSFEAGRQQGFEEGQKAERETGAAHSHAAEERHQRVRVELVAKFEAARSGYLQEVEREVVKLALAVAARILRREAQIDPLLLTGAVRIALGQLANTTEVRLHVPAQERDLWSEAVGLVPHLAARPEIIAQEDLAPGDCRIETEIGSVDLGLQAQLCEIESSFFDQASRKVESNDFAGFSPARPDSDLPR